MVKIPLGLVPFEQQRSGGAASVVASPFKAIDRALLLVQSIVKILHLIQNLVKGIEDVAGACEQVILLVLGILL